MHVVDRAGNCVTFGSIVSSATGPLHRRSIVSASYNAMFPHAVVGHTSRHRIPPPELQRRLSRRIRRPSVSWRRSAFHIC